MFRIQDALELIIKLLKHPDAGPTLILIGTLIMGICFIITTIKYLGFIGIIMTFGIILIFLGLIINEFIY